MRIRLITQPPASTSCLKTLGRIKYNRLIDRLSGEMTAC